MLGSFFNFLLMSWRNLRLLPEDLKVLGHHHDLPRPPWLLASQPRMATTMTPTFN